MSASFSFEVIPRHVVAFAGAADLRTTQLRWCWTCGVVAFAIDDFERHQLTALGFLQGCCPDCREELALRRAA